MYAYVCVCVYVYVCMCVCVCENFIVTRLWIYSGACTYTHTYIHMQELVHGEEIYEQGKFEKAMDVFMCIL